MTLIWTYVVLNPLVLLKRSYFPFTMWLVIMLLMILLLTDLMQFSTLVYHQKLKRLTIIFLKKVVEESPVCFCGLKDETVKHFFLESPLYSTPRTNLLSSTACILIC